MVIIAILGIDLGTSNSAIGYWNGEEAILIPNAHGDLLTPSVVGIDNHDEVVVGKIAKERLITYPEQTFSLFKRYMGTNKTYTIGKHQFTSVDLSAFVLKSLKQDAESYLGEVCDKVVISVPAYFNNLQRQATLDAAKLAGLQVEKLISEPTAAALAYGLQQLGEELSCIVLDLGGGTFDVSILDMFEGIVQVISIAGDNYLGGEDFTKVILQHLLKKCELDFDQLTQSEKGILYKQAEFCKQQLSERNHVEVTFTIQEQAYTYQLTESEWKKLLADLLMKIQHPIIRALQDAKLKPKDFSAVLLIGGATKMPVFRQHMAKFFGKMPYMNLNPDEAVALGAVIQSALLNKNEKFDELILTDVCGYSLGIETAKTVNHQEKSGYFSPIIERNTTIPVSHAYPFYTTHPNQDQLHLKVFQGESMYVKNNILIGEIEFDINPKPSIQEIKVRFTYDKSGILEVIVSLESGEQKVLIIENNVSHALTPEEIKKRLKMLAKIKIHPRERAEVRLLLEISDRLFEESTAEKRYYIQRATEVFEEAIEQQNERSLQKAMKHFEQQLKEIEGAGL
ncbi:molecular chaperone HscC [Isobaculum melis]|uniref:Chaperone protein DnaK n=1 Tax=Isobaculum melis TaxID=142588 RepID=A0A1H9U873_9LACT|nr:molecular chaperone HscC [Isobaculum melis]SES05549.1 molecular chaperone HscC [Isobaculum melis]